MFIKRTYFRISNVKLSVKIPDTCIDKLGSECVKNGFDHKIYGNFIVLKVPSTLDGKSSASKQMNFSVV